MSRTIKQTLARAFHKRLKAAYRKQPEVGWWQGVAAACEAFPFAITRVTRYGVKRAYEAGMKVKERRSDRAKLKETDREEIWDD